MKAKANHYANGGVARGNAGGKMRGREPAAQMSGRAFADGGYVCGHTSGLHGKNMKKGSK
jgi:hypothetical protein